MLAYLKEFKNKYELSDSESVTTSEAKASCHAPKSGRSHKAGEISKAPSSQRMQIEHLNFGVVRSSTPR